MKSTHHYNRRLDKHRKQNSKLIKQVAIGKSSSSGAKKWIPLSFLLLLVLSALFITLNESFFHIPAIPTWRQIYESTGLASASSKYSGVSVHFIDVGQGDCELIIADNATVLIDSGEKEYYARVIDYLESQGIKRLDYVIVTHPHSDHAGSMSYIIDKYDIGKVIMPEIPDELIPSTSTYIRLLKSIERKDVIVEFAKPGLSYRLGSCTLDILAPLKEYDSLNNCSVVAKFTHGSNSFLFTGDIEEEVENDILDSGIDISATVLKVSHHGSSTSSKKKFLLEVGGEYAVIEVGSPNTHNHPNSKIVDRLQSVGYEILRTDKNGNIVFVSDGLNLRAETEK